MSASIWNPGSSISGGVFGWHNVLNYGARGDGVTDDRAAIQAAIDAAHNAGGGTVIIPEPTNFYRLTRALQIKDSVRIYVPNDTTRIVSDSSAAGISWPFYGAILFSSIGSNLSSFTSYPVNNITQCNRNVITTTAANAGNFSVGDVVLVATTTSWGSASIPTWGQMNVVTSVDISTGILGLRHLVDATQTGVVIYKLSDVSVTSNGYTLNAVRDAAIIGGTWEATVNGSNNAPAIVFGAMIDCVVDIHGMKGWTGFPYGNLMFNCDLQARYVETYGRGVELAFLSAYNKVAVGSLAVSRNDLSGSGAPSGLVWLNENATANDVRVQYINAGPITAANLVRLSESSRNTIHVGNAVCNTSQIRGVLIQRPGTSGSPGCYDNEVSVRWASLPAGQFGVVVAGTLESRNTVRDSTFLGTYSVNAVYLNGVSDTTLSDIYFSDGNIQIGASTAYTIKNVRCPDPVAVASNSVKAYASKGYWAGIFAGTRSGSVRLMEPEYTITGIGATTKTLTVPGGAVSHGGAIDYELVVLTAGAGGSKTVKIQVGGVSAVTHTIAAGTVTSVISGRFIPTQSLGGLWFNARRVFGTSEEVSTGSVAVTLSASWNLDFIVTVPTGGDSSQVRVLRAVITSVIDPAAV